MTMKIDTQMNARLLFLIGTIVWFTTAIGHPVLVGIDHVLGMHSPIGPDLRSMLIANTWDFGWLD